MTQTLCAHGGNKVKTMHEGVLPGIMSVGQEHVCTHYSTLLWILYTSSPPAVIILTQNRKKKKQRFRCFDNIRTFEANSFVFSPQFSVFFMLHILYKLILFIFFS